MILGVKEVGTCHSPARLSFNHYRTETVHFRTLTNLSSFRNACRI